MAPTAAAADAVTTRYPALDVESIESSGLNPRTHWDDSADKELQESIRVDGVLEPILVRPHPTRFGRFQIVAGERRFRAAQAVGLGQIPAIVRAVNDEKLLELALTENIQRRSMHPLDEANGFIQRLEMGGTSPEALAHALGLSKRYITDRIRLKKLVPTAAKMLERDEMTVSHAILLAKLDPQLQEDAIEDNSNWEFDYNAPKADQKKVTLHPVADLKDWITRNVPIDPASPEAHEEFPELAAAATEAQAKGATVVILSDQPTPWKHKASAGDPLFRDRWQECKKTDKAAQVGVFVQGRRRGERIYFKPVAPPEPTKSASTSAGSGRTEAEKKRDAAARKREQAAAAKRAEEAKHWQRLKGQARVAVQEHIETLPLKAVIAAVAKEHHVKTTGDAESFLRALATKDATVSDYTADGLAYRAKSYGFDVKKWLSAQIAGMKKAAPAKAAKKAKKR